RRSELARRARAYGGRGRGLGDAAPAPRQHGPVARRGRPARARPQAEGAEVAPLAARALRCDRRAVLPGGRRLGDRARPLGPAVREAGERRRPRGARRRRRRRRRGLPVVRPEALVLVDLAVGAGSRRPVGGRGPAREAGARLALDSVGAWPRFSTSRRGSGSGVSSIRTGGRASTGSNSSTRPASKPAAKSQSSTRWRRQKQPP